jgi:anti-anti-sigma factor
MRSELATIGFEALERAVVARVGGEVDMSDADPLLDELSARIGSRPWLVVDLTGCSYLDSAGLRMIARVDLRCREAGTGLRLVVEPSGAVDRVLSMTRMDEVLIVDRLLADALAGALEEVDGSDGSDAGTTDGSAGGDTP